MGLIVTCKDDAALSMYDRALCALLRLNTKLFSYTQKALELDGSFVMVHCIVAGIYLIGFKPPTDGILAPHLEALKTASPRITDREKAHIRAVMEIAAGDLPGAVEEWMDILVQNPQDILAISFLFSSCIAIGEMEKMRDSLARVLPWWTVDMALYPHILSLVTRVYGHWNFHDSIRDIILPLVVVLCICSGGEQRAQKSRGVGQKGHVIEEEQDVRIGVELLTSTRPKWICSPLDGHISWHLALYYLDLGDTGSVLREFDTVLYDKAVADNLLGLVDASSLLWRLNVMGIDVGEMRWEKVINGFSKLLGTHALTWYDTHMMMSLAHGKVSETSARLAIAEQTLKALGDYSRTNMSTDCKIADTLGVPVCTALLAFGKEQYDDVISLMLPLKSNQLPLALALIAELKAQKPNSVMLVKLFEDYVTVNWRSVTSCKEGGLGSTATVVFKRLASLIADKQELPYCKILFWLRCKLSFSLLRSAVMCLRGSRSTYHRPQHLFESSIDLAIADSKVNLSAM
eukprot:Em0018g150a